MGELRVGKPDVDIEAASHTKGTQEGNEAGRYEKMKGHNRDGTSGAFRSTGINSADKEPIDPSMPNLSPA